MSVWNQIYYTAKRFLVDIKSLAIMLFAYIFIIWILGSAFKNAFENQNFEKVRILTLNEDRGEQGKLFLEQLAGMKELKKIVVFEKAESFEQAERKINKEKAEALVYLPEVFTEQVKQQDQSNVVKVYGSSSSGFSSTIVHGVVESYVNGLNTAGAVYKMNGSLEGFDFEPGEGIEEEPVSSRKQPSSMSYYAIAMICMMVIMSGSYGTEAISDEYHGTIGERMRLSQLKPFVQYTGTVLGTSIVQFIQTGIVMMFASFAYHVNWGENIPLLLFVFFTFCFVSSTFGGMLAMLIGDRQKASTVLGTCTYLFTFLAGGFVVADFGAAKYISLNYYAQTTVMNLIYDGKQSLIIRNVGLMWTFSLIFVVVSVVQARRKRK